MLHRRNPYHKRPLSTVNPLGVPKITVKTRFTSPVLATKKFVILYYVIQ